MELTTKYVFPSNKEFLNLFNSVGWDREVEKIEMHRKATSFCVCIYDKEIKKIRRGK